MRQTAAFTLVEILLVTTLTAGISLAIFTCLSNGLRLWDRSRSLMIEDDIAVFFDRFSSDLRNSFFLSTLSFEGSEFRISFPTVVMARTDSAGSRAFEGVADGLGEVQYLFDPGRQSIVRRQANYSQAVRNVWADERELVKGVSRVRFKYYSAGSNETFFIHDAKDSLPSGIEAEIILMSGSVEKTLRRYVSIPIGL